MTASPPERLDDLVRHLLARLSSAAADRNAAWRSPMLATLTADGAPTLRTVVLRSVDADRRVLALYTNRRSDKVAQLAARPAVELGFWDPAARQQLRVAGSAHLVTEGPMVDAAWEALPEAARWIYLDGTAPGMPLSGPGSSGISVADPQRDVFTVVQVTWSGWDWLWLGPDGHRRARMRWATDGSCRSAWVEP
jgi:general stress protein 26